MSLRFFNTRVLKMVLIVRTDLKLSKGKIASQCSHAAIMCYRNTLDNKPKLIDEWLQQGQPKIVLKVQNLDEMEDVLKEANDHNLVYSIIRDAGRTQIPSGTTTVLGIGPDLTETIDPIIEKLKLL